MDIQLELCILLIIVGLGACFVQRVSGFGLGVLSMLILPHFFTSHVAPAAIVCLCSCVTSSYNTIKYHKNIPYKTALPMIISALCVIPFAIYFSAKVSKGLFNLLLGITLILLSIFLLFFSKKIKFKPTPVKGAIIGIFGGTLSGLFASGGPPAVLYLSQATKTKESYFASIQFYFAVCNIFATIMRIINGILILEYVIYAGIGLVGCLIGDTIGRLVFNKLNGEKIKLIIYIGMIISGVIMII